MSFLSPVFAGRKATEALVVCIAEKKDHEFVQNVAHVMCGVNVDGRPMPSFIFVKSIFLGRTSINKKTA